VTTYIYPDEIHDALRAVDFDSSQLVIDGDLIFTSEQEHRDWEIEIGCRCGCEHLVSDHIDQGDGYQVCRYCVFERRQYSSGLVIWWGCVLDAHDGCGVAASDYAKVRGVTDRLDALEIGPDAFRWTPE
jgi:hypothetical protein